MATNVGEIVYQVQMDVAQLLTSQREITTRLNEMDRGFDRTSRSVQGAEQSMFSFSKAAGLVLSALSAGAIINAVDDWGQMAARIKMALNSVEGDIGRYEELQNRFLEASNRNGKAIETTQALYVGSATSMQELGYNTAQTVDYIESLSSAFTANATGAQQTESAMNSLTRAMVTGKLKGNDWDAVIGAMPTTVRDVANELSRLRGGIKVTETDVKKMAATGGISMKLFADSMINARDANNELASSMDNTVVDSLTKGMNSAKAYYGELNQLYGVTRTMSAGIGVVADNFDKVSVAIAIAAAIMSGKYIAAMGAAIKTKVGLTTASIAQTKATAEAAAAESAAASVTVRKTAADKAAAFARLALVKGQHEAAIGTMAETTALNNLIAKKAIATDAAIIHAQALKAETVAIAGAAAAARSASLVLNTLKGALALVGGPMGAAMLAGMAIFYFYQKSEQAKEEAKSFAESVDTLRESLDKLTLAGLRGKMAEANDHIVVQQKEVGILKADLKALHESYRLVSNGVGTFGDNSKRLAELQGEIDKKTDALEGKTRLLAASTQFVSDATAELNKRMKDAEAMFGGATTAADRMSNAVKWMASEIKKAADEKARLNNEMSIEPRSEDGDKYIQQLKDQNELLSIVDKKERAVAAERRRQLNAGTVDGSKQMQEAIALVEAYYDLSKADQERGKSSKSSTEAINEAEAAIKRQDESLKRLNTGFKEGSLEMAKYDAAMSLGAKATEPQIIAAQRLAAAIHEITLAKENQRIAEQGQEFAVSSINASKSPLEQIDIEEQAKLAKVAEYQAIDIANKQLYEDAKTAIELKAAEDRQRIFDGESIKRTQAISDMLGAASQGFDGMAGIAKSAAGEQSGAYRALFAVSKAFAVAQAALNFQTALSNAMAIPWPANIPAIAQATAAGGQVVSAISGINYGGARYNGGPVDAGSMYRVGEGGKPEIFKASNGNQYMIPGDNGKVISNKDMQGGGKELNVSVVFNDYSSGRHQFEAQASQSGDTLTVQAFLTDMQEKGPLHRSITQNTTASTRL